MKRYILGNYELSICDIVELEELIKSRLDDLAGYSNYCCNDKLVKIYDEKSKGLNLMLDELKRYGD